MDSSLLEQLGLNPTQAKAYIATISSGAITPPILAEKVKITRTNAYEVLDQLSALKLVEKVPGKKLHYRALNPVALEKLAEKKRAEAHQNEQQLHAAMPQLMTYFYTYSEQPGVRFFQGRPGITAIYEDMLRTRQPTLFLATNADHEYMSLDFYLRFHRERIKLGIKTTAIMPDSNNKYDPVSIDPTMFTRTWFKPDDYTAPVEICVYGDKVSHISFGEEAMGVIIESPQIAEAMRQILTQLGRYFATVCDNN